MLVIADGARPQAVAGVMGGALSEVSSRTRTIVLESACFEPKSVRSTSKRLGLKTEASARFERGTDIGAPVKGLERAIALLEQIGAGQPARVDRRSISSTRRRREQLSLRRRGSSGCSARRSTPADVQRILTGLGFALTPPKTAHGAVTVPTFRVDVLREVDLIEEVGRHHGYDRLPTTFPALSKPSDAPDPRLERDRLVRRVLLAAGCSEALTFSFIDAAMASQFAESPVPIGNPLSTQFAVMRPSLLPGLLAAVAHNRNRQRPDVRLFELGAVFTRPASPAASPSRGPATRADRTGAASAATSTSSTSRASSSASARRSTSTLRSRLRRFAVSRGRPRRHRRRCTGERWARSAWCRRRSPPRPDAGDDVYVAELDLDALSATVVAAPVKAQPLPRFPSIARDISIVVDDILPAEAVRGTIRSAAPDTLVSVREFDRYQGKGVPERRVSLSLRLTFRSPERTLTDAEVQKAMDAILAALIKDHHAVQR